MRERWENSRDALLHLGEIALPIVLALWLSTGSFSRSIALEIKKRDKWKCTECGGKNSKRLEAAHRNHFKKSRIYDKTDNGMTLCVKCHYLQHLNGHGNGTLGLSKENNIKALAALWKRLSSEEREGLPNYSVLREPAVRR